MIKAVCSSSTLASFPSCLQDSCTTEADFTQAKHSLRANMVGFEISFFLFLCLIFGDIGSSANNALPKPSNNPIAPQEQIVPNTAVLGHDISVLTTLMS